MARSHGRIHSAIWTDPDFLALEVGPQRMYMFLLSQPNLNHAGLLPLTMNRWASRCRGMTAASVRADLEVLAAARFIVLDLEAEELLVRTLVRGDGVYRQPLVMKRLVEDAQEITSPKLRAALLLELTRLPIDALSDDPTGKDKTGPSVRAVATESREAIRGAFGDPLAVAPAYPSGRVSETLPEGSEEGSREPSPRTGAPPPSPFPLPPLSPTGAETAPPESSSSNPPLPPQTAQELVADWIDHCSKRPPGQVVGHVAKHIGAMLEEGIDPVDIRRGVAAWQTKGANPSALPGFVHQVMNSPPPATRAAANGGRRLTPDERVATIQALKLGQPVPELPRGAA